MINPEYIAPNTIEEASAILAGNPQGAKIIAGGTDLVVQMRAGVIHPEMLVDLRLLPLDEIHTEDNGFQIGSRVTHSQVAASDELKEKLPALAAACRAVGGPSIRNRGTLGGNLANASPAADTALPLLAYDASIVIMGNGAERTLPLSELFKGYRQNAMESGEIIKEIRVPIPPENTAARFIKLGKRRAMFIAVVGVAVRITLNENRTVKAVRVVLGSVAPFPYRAKPAEEVLTGNALSHENIVEAANRASQASSPISDFRASTDYRKKMVAVLVRRALTEAREELLGVERNG